MSTTRTASTSNWQKFVSFVAGLLNKSSDADLDKIHDELLKIGGDGTDSGVDAMKMAEATNDEELKNVLKALNPELGDKIVKVNIGKIRNYAPVVPPVETSKPPHQPSGGVGQPVPQIDLMPKFTQDDDFLRLLMTGGTLKVDEITVQSGVRAAIDEQMGVFQIPNTLHRRMKELTDQTDEPHGDDFYKIDAMLSKRTHGPVFSALGISSSYYTEASKRQLLDSIRNEFFPALYDFYQQILRWKESVVAEASLSNGPMITAMFNPAAASTMLALQNPPSIAQLQESAKTVVQKASRAFRGHGIPVSRALANEAMEIAKLIEPSQNLHAKLNFPNRDQMLGYLGFNSVQDILRSRNYLIRFALGVINLSTGEVQDGQTGVMYVAQLLNLASSIAWSSLGFNSSLATTPPRPTNTSSRRRELDSDAPYNGRSSSSWAASDYPSRDGSRGG